MIISLITFLKHLRKLLIKYLYFSPNVITLIGLSFNVTLFFISVWYSGWSGHEKIPSFAVHIMSLCYLIYYYFDNLDGKQARRIKLSTPLGSILDHCCDSMTSFLITTSIATIIQCTHLYQYAIIWLMAAFPFYATIWEENITNYFYLPEINGVSEGTVVTCIAIHFFGLFGVDYLNDEITFLGINTIKRNILLIAFFIVGLIFTAIR